MKHLRDFYPWLEENRIPLPDTKQEAKLTQFLELLLSWNRKINLTADNNRDTLLTRHLLDSLTPLSTGILNENPVVDIGSGTGFPAIPLSVMLPETPFVLIEKVARKCAFLKMAARRLKLRNIWVAETLLRDWNPESPVPRIAVTRAVRVDGELKEQLLEKGIYRLLYFSSQATGSTILKYQLPSETKNRYLDKIELG